MEHLFNEHLDLYFKSVAIAVLAWLMAALKDLNADLKTAQSMDAEFSYKVYFKKEAVAIAMNFIAMLITTLLIPSINQFTEGNELTTLITVGSLSFGGAMLINYAFGRFGKELKGTLIKRSKRLDEHENTVGQATPIEK